MTPQEIVDYKRKWMGYSKLEVKIHSDHTSATRSWLKDHVPKQQYHVMEHTNVYETTVVFEDKKHHTSFLHWHDAVETEYMIL